MKVIKELIVSGVPEFKSCHASSVAALPNGSYYAVWFAGSREGADDVQIWGSSRDKSSWSKPQILTEEQNVPHWNPVLFVRDDGSVMLFYKIGKEISSWQTKVMVSYDCCESWSESKELVAGDKGGRGPVRNKVIALSNGRLLAPASSENCIWHSFSDFSDDNGASWEKSNDIYIDLQGNGEKSKNYTDIPVSEQSFFGRGVIQPTLWQSEDRTVHMFMRSTEGLIFRSDSSDYGKSWGKAYPTKLPNNNSGIDLVKANNGKLFLVYNPVGKNWGPRTPLELAVSEDNGDTWEKVMNLEDNPGEYSYPAIISINNCLFITYTYNRGNIAFWRIDLE